MIIKHPYGQEKCILPMSCFEGRYIPNFHPESLEAELWWEEQIRRCREGYSDGGFNLPGNYYYHLNFKKINALDINDEEHFNFPYFCQEDLDLFLEMKDARRDGKGMMLITGRGFGKSYAASTISEHQFIFYPASYVIVSASTVPFVNLLFNKIRDGINSVPADLRPSLLVDKADYIESGYKETSDGKDETKGFRSKIWKVAYDDKSGKTRGTRPNIHIFEEVGSWTGAAKLRDCYSKTEASWWRGKKFRCFPLLIGTGGEMESGGSEDAREMFYNPEAYNLKVYITGEGHKTGKFVPAYKKFEGFYEESGVSDEIGAREFLENRRESKKRDNDIFLQEIQEFPFEPEEAFMTKGGDWLPVQILQNRVAEIYKDPRLKAVVKRGRLEWEFKGSQRIGVKFIEDPDGWLEVAEEPFKKEGIVPKNLYVSGCDSFDAILEEDTKKKSQGSLFIYKRMYDAQQTSHLFVAKMTQRTKDDEEFFENTWKVNMWYSSQMLVEYTKLGIIRYYITNKLTSHLMRRPKLEQDGVLKTTSSTNTYGVAMPEKVKIHAIRNYARYITSNNQQMYFLSQLEDAIKFRFGSNQFDETMAAAITLMAEDELHNSKIRLIKKKAFYFPTFMHTGSGIRFGIPHDNNTQR